MIKTACFQRDTDSLTTRNDRKWKRYIVFPMFFPHFPTLTMFVIFTMHTNPQKLISSLAKLAIKSDNLYDLLPCLRISDKPSVLVHLAMLKKFNWLKLISYYLLDRNDKINALLRLEAND